MTRPKTTMSNVDAPRNANCSGARPNTSSSGWAMTKPQAANSSTNRQRAGRHPRRGTSPLRRRSSTWSGLGPRGGPSVSGTSAGHRVLLEDGDADAAGEVADEVEEQRQHHAGGGAGQHQHDPTEREGLEDALVLELEAADQALALGALAVLVGERRASRPRASTARGRWSSWRPPPSLLGRRRRSVEAVVGSGSWLRRRRCPRSSRSRAR